ncbi:hypothetical protein PVK06_036249 [Gossypium arboreum]|uniref:Uncharacterized protein n=1 Tax=Gossypium arboreum TaxID=29729 RepID=A0ABR0NJD8_GOSAR|nr:hypothetical protein PVK06_036249 [Gossypium arboreum]
MQRRPFCMFWKDCTVGEKVEVDSPEEVLNARVNVNPNLASQPMAQTIRQLAEAPMEQPPLCIAFFSVSRAAELRREIIRIRPKTHGDEYGRRREWRSVGQHDSTTSRRLNLHDGCKFSAISSQP